ncbi:MAG: poly(R)-hydroxyalkanoic acid synthase subunit PhaE [Steroidobacteraceae bacterium]
MENHAGWAQQWIEQQRALLELAAQTGSSKAEGGFEQVNELRQQWSELGKTYLDGLMQMAQSANSAAADAPGAGPRSSAQPGVEVFEAWKAAWSNSLVQAAAPGGWSELLTSTPPLGLFREQIEAWRAVAAARGDVERLEQELAAVLRRVQSDALTLLAEQVKARAATAQPVQGFRDFYNLWVECSEQVFSIVAHSSAYCHLQGELGNASMRLRARVQKVIEQGLRQFDLPTRSEINSLHQQVRLLKQRLAVLEGESTARTIETAPARKARKRSR